MGGTINREAATASLRPTIDCQIITPEVLYCWVKNNIKGGTSFYVPSFGIIEHGRNCALE